MTEILRYDKCQGMWTPLDPLEDMASMICGVRSIGYTSDLLRVIHGMSDSEEIGNCAKSISHYVEGALGLMDQAYSGPPEVSFLPLYYMINGLSKVYIVLAGRRAQLLEKENRYHGASWTRKNSRKLFTEEVTLCKGGVLPLFYKALTGSKWNFNGKKLRVGDFYPCIHGISLEYALTEGKSPAFQAIRASIEECSSQRFRVVLVLGESDHPRKGNPRYLKILEGFQRDPKEREKFVGKAITAPTESEARPLVLKDVKRHLLYELSSRQGPPVCHTVLSSSDLLLPEELPIWMAFFHLSNVVRYSPEFLYQVRDSKSWPMLLALRKHAVLRFLVLFYSYLHQTVFYIRGV